MGVVNVSGAIRGYEVLVQWGLWDGGGERKWGYAVLVRWELWDGGGERKWGYAVLVRWELWDGGGERKRGYAGECGPRTVGAMGGRDGEGRMGWGLVGVPMNGV